MPGVYLNAGVRSVGNRRAPCVLYVEADRAGNVQVTREAPLNKSALIIPISLKEYRRLVGKHNLWYRRKLPPEERQQERERAQEKYREKIAKLRGTNERVTMTPETVWLVLDLYAKEGKSFVDIAVDPRVKASPSNVSRICRGERHRATFAAWRAANPGLMLPWERGDDSSSHDAVRVDHSDDTGPRLVTAESPPDRDG